MQHDNHVGSGNSTETKTRMQEPTNKREPTTRKLSCWRYYDYLIILRRVWSKWLEFTKDKGYLLMFMRMKRDIGSVSCTPNFRFECISQSGSHQIMLYCIGITGVGATSIEDYFAGQSFEQVDRILNWESHSEIV